MILLPRGNPVKERLNPGRVQLAEALQKLKKNDFSGYLRFLDPAGEGIVIFADGRLISSLFMEGTTRHTGEEALRRIFTTALHGRGTLDIYRLSPALAESVYALLHGDVLYRAQELKLIDIKALLARLKTDCISGCLRIYTAERVALIFYRDGAPLGFFHDGASQIETSADTSMSVAQLPGAKIDVLTTGTAGETATTDLLTLLDLPALWREAQQQVTQLRRERQDEQLRARARQGEELRAVVLDMLRETAGRHIGRIGPSLVDKEFEKLPAETSFSGEGLATFYSGLGRAAKLVAGSSAIKEMILEMQQGVAERLEKP